MDGVRSLGATLDSESVMALIKYKDVSDFPRGMWMTQNTLKHILRNLGLECNVWECREDDPTWWRLIFDGYNEVIYSLSAIR
jgi:hypothetical protein